MSENTSSILLETRGNASDSSRFAVVYRRHLAGGNQQRAAAPAECAPGIEQPVIGGAVCERVITELGHVDFTREGAAIECLDVLDHWCELESFEIDPAVHEGIEHEAVIGTRREPERERHERSRIRKAASFRWRMA
jgi:hypothetical protein